MDERRDPPLPPQDAWPPLAAASQLSPVQRAYGAYTGHAVACEACRDVDRTCGTADRLWKAWKATTDDACEQLAGGAG